MTARSLFRSRTMIRLAVALSVAAASGCRSTEPVDFSATGTLFVNVVDQNNAAVSGATVTLDMTGSGTVKQTRTTSGSGQAAWELVPAGTHSVYVDTPVGYTGGGQANAVDVTIVKGQNTTQKVTLNKTTATSPD